MCQGNKGKFVGRAEVRCGLPKRRRVGVALRDLLGGQCTDRQEDGGKDGSTNESGNFLFSLNILFIYSFIDIFIYVFIG